MKRKRFVLNFCDGPACNRNDNARNKSVAEEALGSIKNLEIGVSGCLGYCRCCCNAELLDYKQKTRDVFNGIREKTIKALLKDIASKLND